MPKAETRLPLATPVPADALADLAGALLTRLFRQLDLGVALRLWNGRQLQLWQSVDRSAGQDFTLVFHSPATVRELVLGLLGPGRSELEIQRCVLSVLGQVLAYKHARSVIDHICPEVLADAAEIERTAEHIAAFSLAALHGLAAQAPTPTLSQLK